MKNSILKFKLKIRKITLFRKNVIGGNIIYLDIHPHFELSLYIQGNAENVDQCADLNIIIADSSTCVVYVFFSISKHFVIHTMSVLQITIPRYSKVKNSFWLRWCSVRVFKYMTVCICSSRSTPKTELVEFQKLILQTPPHNKPNA